VLQCVAVCCSVLQRVSLCFSVLQLVLADYKRYMAEEWERLVAACCSILQCVEYVVVCADRLERQYGRRVGVGAEILKSQLTAQLSVYNSYRTDDAELFSWSIFQYVAVCCSGYCSRGCFENCRGVVYTALLSAYRALSSVCRAHFNVSKTLLNVYRAPLNVYRARLNVHRAHLNVCRALLNVYKALELTLKSCRGGRTSCGDAAFF